MHPRILTLEISLVRLFQLPVELRTIIVEDFFPFLPFETDRFFFRQLVENHPKIRLSGLQFKKLGTISRLQWNCSKTLYLEAYVHIGNNKQVRSYLFSSYVEDICFDRFSDREGSYCKPTTTAARSFCNGYCRNRKLFVEACSDKKTTFPMKTNIASVDGDYLAQSEQEVFLRFHQNVLAMVRY